jgi:hypothetical protein
MSLVVGPRSTPLSLVVLSPRTRTKSSISFPHWEQETQDIQSRQKAQRTFSAKGAVMSLLHFWHFMVIVGRQEFNLSHASSDSHDCKKMSRVDQASSEARHTPQKRSRPVDVPQDTPLERNKIAKTTHQSVAVPHNNQLFH